RLMQLEKPKILRRGRIRRAAEKGCKCPDVPDILVVRLLDEVAHRHVFDHAPAQRADGFITHRGAPVLRWRLLEPLDSQDRTLGLSLSPAHLVTPSVPLAPLRAQRAPAKRVRSLAQSGRPHDVGFGMKAPPAVSSADGRLEKRTSRLRSAAASDGDLFHFA